MPRTNENYSTVQHVRSQVEPRVRAERHAEMQVLRRALDQQVDHVHRPPGRAVNLVQH